MKSIKIILMTSLILSYIKASDWCTTPSPEEDYYHSIGVYRYVSDYEPKIINVFFYIFKPSVGTGGYSNIQVDELLTILNSDFSDSDISFTDVGRKTIRDDNFYNSTSIYDLTATFGHSNAVDIFLVNGFEANAGSIPSNSIIYGTRLSGEHVISHEMGHSFSLYHTHEFQAGGAEYPWAPDCENKGDFVCDTPPDPNLHHGQWVDENCDYIHHIDQDPEEAGIQDLYNPDCYNLESYTSLECLTWFTNGQVERMHTGFDESDIMDAYVENISVPQNLIWSNSNNHPLLEWDAVTDSNIDGYSIFRSTNEGEHCAEYQLIASLPDNITSYLDNEIDIVNPKIAINSAEYYVTAVNNVSDISFHSNIISVPTNIANKIVNRTDSWELATSINFERYDHSAILLPDGRVFVAGGVLYNEFPPYIDKCEIYNPYGNSWVLTDDLNYARSNHTSTLLDSEFVLITGGLNENGSLSSTELFFIADNSIIEVDSMNNSRNNHASIKLSNGKILVSGGFFESSFGESTIGSCEIFDPLSGQWEITGELNYPRGDHQAILLSNGNVMVVGGHEFWGTPVNTVEFFDPTTELWTEIDGTIFPRPFISLETINENIFLISGGNIDTCEVFNYVTSTWSEVAPFEFSREYGMKTVKLVNGNVLLTGTREECEVFSVPNMSWVRVSDMPSVRFNHTLTLLESGKVLLVGGNSSHTTYIYNPDTTTVGSQIETDLPKGYSLHNNFPNPFNPKTTIRYEIPEYSVVTLKLYNINGHLVKTLIDGDQNPGSGSVVWDGTNKSGLRLSSGIYIFIMRAKSIYSNKLFTSTKKMIFLK
ncbi:MAG: hypothetical protein HOH03_10210 [Candidatus Marinimicrobia bacterium]|nr:hypothetical protein [Candidatus Neomarinimicrobiota bacterium]